MWFLSCSYTDIKTIAFQVVQGLSFLNAHGIVNRNLSPVNIVFTPKVRIFTIHGHNQMSFWFLMHQIPVHSIPIIHDSLLYLFIVLSGLRHCESEKFAQENNTIDSMLASNQTSWSCVHWALTSFTALYCSNYL